MDDASVARLRKNISLATSELLERVADGSLGHLRHRIAIVNLGLRVADYVELLASATDGAGVSAPTSDEVRGWLDWTDAPSGAHRHIIERALKTRGAVVPASEWGERWMPTRFDQSCFAGLPIGVLP